MFFLASEIDEIIALTGNISLPQIVVTVANVILLAVNIVLAIIKKVKKIKNEKEQGAVEPTPFPAVINNELPVEKKKTMNTILKFKVSIFKEIFEEEDELLVTAEEDELASAVLSCVGDIPLIQDGDAQIKLLLNTEYVRQVSLAYAKTNNIKVLAALKNILAAFGYKMTITLKKTEEVITYVDREELLI